MVGTRFSGSTAEVSNTPYRICVTIDLAHYVAEMNNNRVQLFRSGQRNGTAVARCRESATIALNQQTGVVADGDGYLFRVDSSNNRIVGSDRHGFR